jgi:hypothetical protein
MRARLIPLVVCGALIGGLAAVALGQVGRPSPARAAAVRAVGAFEISNSGEGEPIFAADGLAPGGSAQGKVTIEDSGSGPIALTLRRGELADTPGSGGGVLSERLRLTVADVTEPTRPRTIYAGPLDSMPEQDAGELQPGGSRTYEFTATLPDGSPSAQNPLQEAATTVAYSWTAGEIGGGEETPTEPPGGGENRAAPAGGGDAVTVGARLKLSVPKLLPRLSRGVLVAYVDCDGSCRIDVRGRLWATADGHQRTAKIHFSLQRIYTPGAKKMRIPIPRGMHDWLRRMLPPKGLRAKLRFSATGTEGGRDLVKTEIGPEVRRR